MSYLAPLVVCWLAGAALLPFDGRTRWASALAAVVVFAAFVADAGALWRLLSTEQRIWDTITGDWPQGIGIRLRVDGISLFFATVCTGILAAVMLHETIAGIESRLFPALLLLLAAGLQGAFFTADLFNFYVFFELSVVSSFALAAYGYGAAQIRATFLYIVLNLLGSVLFLMGVAAAYHITGTLDLQQIASVSPQARGLLVLPASLLFAALILKLGLFPFHGWIPVLYSHARPAVVAALAGALANLAAYGLLRFGFTAFAGARREAVLLLLLLGSAAIIYGALLAAYRRRPAEIAAYSSIMHAGQVVVAIGIGGRAGVVAALLIVLAGSFDKATMFLALDAPGRSRRIGSLVAAASTAGFPPTLGFIAKVFLVYAAVSNPTHHWVVAVIILGAIVELGAVFRFWRLLQEPVIPPLRSSGIAVATLAVVSLLAGVLPGPIAAIAWEIGGELAGGQP